VQICIKFGAGETFVPRVQIWVPPVRRRCPRRAHLAAHHCHVAATRRARTLNALSGPRASVFTAPRRSERPRSDRLSELPRLAPSRPRRRRCPKPRRRPCPKLVDVRLSPLSRDSSTVSVTRALLSPFFIRGASSSRPLPPPHRKTVAGHHSPTSSEKRRRRANFLTLTVDEELR
jgi:hypothetical protein